MNAFELARYEAGLSQQEAAEKADVSVRTIARLERGETRATAPVARALADAYACPVTKLLGIQEPA